MAGIKNLVNFAAKFFDMAKAKGKDKKAKAKPTVKAKSKPAAKKVSKPVAKKAVKKAAPKKQTAKPVKKAKPVAKKATKPVAKKAAKPAAKKAPAKNDVTKALKNNVAKAKPVEQKPVKATKQTAAKPVIKQAAKPVVTKPEPKVTVKPAAPAPTFKKPTMIPEETNETHLRYSDEDLKEFKDLIDKKLVAAREELKNLKEALDNHTESQAGNKAWNMEEGTDTSEMEYLMNQISRQHQYIRNLELALVRVENKTYGICRVTGKLIPKERLRIVPHATMSLEAKMSRKSDEDTNATATAAAPPTDFAEGFED